MGLVIDILLTLVSHLPKVVNWWLFSPKRTKELTAKTMIRKIVDSLVDQFGEEAVVAFSDELEHKKRKI